MIVSSQSDASRWMLWSFLVNHGVKLQRSEDFQAIGRLGTNGSLLGVIGYNGFTGLTCQIHTAGDGNWVSRELIKATFHYPFVQLKLEHLFAPVAATNSRALRFDRRMGFKDALRIENGWDHGEDLILLTMAKKDCRWINLDVQERKAA